MAILNPNTINSTPAMEIVTLASKFPNIIPSAEIEQVDSEWKELQFMDRNDLPEHYRKARCGYILG